MITANERLKLLKPGELSWSLEGSASRPVANLRCAACKELGQVVGLVGETGRSFLDPSGWKFFSNTTGGKHLGWCCPACTTFLQSVEREGA